MERILKSLGASTKEAEHKENLGVERDESYLFSGDSIKTKRMYVLIGVSILL